MKVRSPLKIEAPSLDSIPESRNGHPVTYEVKTITPIYGGGVEAGVSDTDMPIRATAIRGQLRYWWRFLAMNRKDSPLSGEALFQEERRIWGGMTDNPDEDGSSKVFIKCLVTKKQQPYQYSNDQPQYALFPARGDNNSPPKSLIKEGVEFRLSIQTTEEIDFKEGILPAIRWWVCFGGIGARTRRGLGTVEIIDNNFSPVTADEAEQFGCKLILLNANNAAIAWTTAINMLQRFRQGEEIARNGRYGRSKWPEADSVRQATRNWNPKDLHAPRTDRLPIPSFPRAMFGMPINFEFKSQSDMGIPPTTQLTPEKFERMSSPLILKALAQSRNKYSSIALLLPYTHLNKQKIKLKYTEEKERRRNGEIIKTFDRDTWWPTDHNEAQDRSQQINPLINRGTDALTAFMNFFANGGE